MGPRGHPAGSAAGLHSPRPSWGSDQQSLPAPATLALGPHRGRAAGMAPGPGMLPSVAGDRPGPWHPVYITMALWCNGDMLGWGGGVLCWLLSRPLRVQSTSLGPWGKGVKDRVSRRVPSTRLQGVSPCQGSLVPTCPVSERCAGSKGEQLMGAWGGHRVE